MIILFIKERYKPCFDLSSLWSDERSTITSPSSTLIAILEYSCFSSPNFPFTVIIPSFTSTVTPDGMVTGLLPILDISYKVFLVYVTNYLSTYIQLFCFLPGHKTFRSRNNSNTKTIQDSW